MHTIIQSSSYIKNLILNETKANVLSVFPNAIYLATFDHIFILQTKDTLMTPISLLTDCTAQQFKNLQVRMNDSVQLLENKIIIHDTVFHISESVLDLNIQAQPRVQIEPQNIYPLYQSALSSILPNKGFEDIVLPNGTLWENSPTSKYAKTILDDLKMAILNKNISDIQRHVVKLVGLGEGLTPSGDDFIIGLLFITKYLNTNFSIQVSEALKQTLIHELYETNAISSTLIECAIKDEFSEVLYKIIHSTTQKELVQLIQYNQTSSHADTLSGILFFLELI